MTRIASAAEALRIPASFGNICCGHQMTVMAARLVRPSVSSSQSSGRLGAAFFKASSRTAERARHGRIMDRQRVTSPEENLLDDIFSFRRCKLFSNLPGFAWTKRRTEGRDRGNPIEIKSTKLQAAVRAGYAALLLLY